MAIGHIREHPGKAYPTGMEAQRREPVKNLECAMQRYGLRVVTRGEKSLNKGN